MTVIDPYENPDNVPEYTDLNLQRRFRVIFGMAIAVLLLMGWMLVRSLGTSNEDSLRDRNVALVKANLALTNTNASQQLLIDKLATALDVANARGANVPAPEVIAAETPGAEVSPPEGAQGERGDAGIPGATGSSGLPGVTGGVGEQGSIGPRGLPGVAGADGAPGANGSQGPVGPAGQDGTPGANGAPGADGAPGGQGPPGDQGPGPSDAQIAAAVAAYCSVPGNCTLIP